MSHSEAVPSNQNPSLEVEPSNDLDGGMMARPWTYFSLLLGVLLLSLAAIFTRLTENELSVSATVFNRYLFATIALGLWELFGKQVKPMSSPPLIDTIDRSLIGVSSILGTLAVSLWALSLTQTSVANSNLLHNITPVFAVIGGWLFMNQQFGPKYLLGMLFAMAGVAMMSMADLQQSSGSLLGDGIALLSAVFYASNYLVREKLRVKFTTSEILFWTCLLSSI
ncbi:MAG: DMT family transporter [Cyanobium sp.]